MDFPLNKLPTPKYTDKPSKHKDKKKTVLVSHIDKLLDESYMNNFFGGHKKTHQKKSTVTKKIDSKRTERKRQTK